jgi:hypothetical protein
MKGQADFRRCAFRIILAITLVIMAAAPALEAAGPEGPSASATVTETRYMRGIANEVTVNSLQTYHLDIAQSSTFSSSATLGNNNDIYVGIRVYNRSAAGIETEITSGVSAIVSRLVNGQGLQSAAWTPPLTPLDPTDSIVIRTFIGQTSPPATASEVFTTGQLNATQLDNVEWTVWYYTLRGVNTRWIFGDSTYNSRIDNFTFTKPDPTNPSISITGPTDGATNVPVAEPIVITFDKEIDTGTVTCTCNPDPGGWTPSWNGPANTVLTLTHNAFAESTAYTFNVTVAQDTGGNALVAGAVANPWTFTTGDFTAPTITSTSPTNGATNIAIAANIVVTFSEAINTGTVAYTCNPDPGGWTPGWNGPANTELTLTHNAFAESTLFTLTITAAQDIAGNPLGVGAAPNPWTFTTGTAADTTPPETVTTVPAANATGIALTADIVVTFSETMNSGTVTYTCNPDPTGWSVVWTAGDMVATFTHSAEFGESTLYTFEITAGEDTAGNSLAAGAVPNPWNFTTGDFTAPTIIETTFPDNATAVSMGAGQYTAVFSEPMGAVGNVTTNLPGASGYWVNATAYRVNYTLLAALTNYRLEYVNFTDTAGNPLGGITIWNFTTSDFVEPAADAGPDQAVDQGETVTFDGSGSIAAANYTWNFTDDGNGINLYGAAPSYLFNNSGLFVVTLNVTDGAGHWDTDTMTVTVNDITPPVANAGPDRLVEPGTMVFFNGSASLDNAGITNYTWSFNDNGTAIALYGVRPAHRFDNDGIFAVTLTVTDAAGNWGSDKMNVTVLEFFIPVANAGPDQTVNEAGLVTFDGSASTHIPGPANFTWAFTYNGTSRALYGISPSYRFWTPGNYIVTLSVRDSLDSRGSDTMALTVRDITPPVANAGPDQTLPFGTLVIFTGGASADNVGIANFTWTFMYNGTTQTLYGVSPSFRFWSAGNHTVTLTARDAAGNAATDTIVVAIGEAPAPVKNPGIHPGLIALPIIIIVLLVLLILFARKKPTSVIETVPADDATNVVTSPGTYVLRFNKAVGADTVGVLTDLPDAEESWPDAKTMHITYSKLEKNTLYTVELSGQEGQGGTPGQGDTAPKVQLGGKLKFSFTTGEPTTFIK